MAEEKVIHAEDVVCLLRNKDTCRRVGLVIRSGNDSTDSDDSSDYTHLNSLVKNGEINVCWYPSGKEEVVSLQKVEIIDRSVQPSDVIRHASIPHQKGYVQDIQIFADIQVLGTSKIIRNVDCKKYLSPIEPFDDQTRVSLGPWIGYVCNVHTQAVLFLRNGSRCLIENDDLESFTDTQDKRDEDCPFLNCLYYPSQSVIGPSQALRAAKWLTKIKPILGERKKIKAVIEELKVVKLEVDWQLCGSLPPGCKKEDRDAPPDRFVTEENISKLKIYNDHSHQIQIGDKSFYVLKEEDFLDNDDLTTSDDHNEDHDNLENLSSGAQSTEAHFPEKSCVNENGNDLESSDSEHESESSMKTLSRRKNHRKHQPQAHQKHQLQDMKQFKPGDRVCVEIIMTKTRADVMWQNGRLEKNIDSLNLVCMYHVDDNLFLPGYTVNDKRAQCGQTFAVKSDKYGIVQSFSDVERTCCVRWLSLSGEDLGLEDDISVYDLIADEDMAFNPGELVIVMDAVNEACCNHRTAAGTVAYIDLEGYVVVKWLSNEFQNESRHRPSELYRFEIEENKSDSSNDSVDRSGSDTWETASDETPLTINEDDRVDNEPSLIGSPPEESSRIATVDNVDIEALNNASNLCNGQSSHSNNLKDEDSFLMLTEVHESHHFYADHIAKCFTPDEPRKFMSVLHKEMKLLKGSLPPGIFIRGFENAMELFTVLITGPKDTPYEGGVFLFDLKLPPDYPTSPPLVFFISMTTDVLNPNLYVDGTVCTSLLGTWSGKDCEKWTPKSNLLQVLLSIQALILCKEPYYNEAGYERIRGSAEGIENSRVYNEMAILHVIASMTAAVKLDHPVFKEQIRSHFEQEGPSILERCKKWCEFTDMKTCKEDGCSKPDATNTKFPLFPLSKGFCKCLQRCVEKFQSVLLEEKIITL